jgi:hypothetical protein
MHALRNSLLTVCAVCGLCFFVARSTANEGHAMTGVLIDNACGAKVADETAAAKHPMKCSLKDACAASGYQLVVGDKHYKLDDKGNEQAKAYLAHADSNRVTIEGTMDGDTMNVTSIKAATKESK